MKEPGKEKILKEALELLWYADMGYSIQKKVKDFFEKVDYDFYKREKWKLKKQ